MTKLLTQESHSALHRHSCGLFSALKQSKTCGSGVITECTYSQNMSWSLILRCHRSPEIIAGLEFSPWSVNWQVDLRLQFAPNVWVSGSIWARLMWMRGKRFTIKVNGRLGLLCVPAEARWVELTSFCFVWGRHQITWTLDVLQMTHQDLDSRIR